MIVRTETRYPTWHAPFIHANAEANQVLCRVNECVAEVVKAMRAACRETGMGKPYSANSTMDDSNVMFARGTYCLRALRALSG